MNCSPQLTAKEFSDIHNAKCELHGILQSMDGVIHPTLQVRLQGAIAKINAALKNAYELDEAVTEKRTAHYDAISEEHGFKSIWSVYEVEDLNAPFAGAATHLVYKDHSGKKPVVVPIDGNTWVDLWRAADVAITRSGDNHHIFIESFKPVLQPGFLVLSTGS